MNDDEDVVLDPEFVESTEDGDELAGSAQIKKLQEKIKSLEKEKTEYLDGWQRARADYANLQKSTDEDKKRFKELFAERFVEDLIPVVDSFSMAMGNKEAWEKVEPTWRTGVEYIYNQLMAALQGHGLTLIGEPGEVFDPTLHEAISEHETDNPANDHTVMSVIQKGVKLADTVIRPARVVVYKAV